MSPSGSLTSLHFLASSPYGINLVTRVSSNDIPILFLKTDSFPLCISMEFLPYCSFDASHSFHLQKSSLVYAPTLELEHLRLEDEGAH